MNVKKIAPLIVALILGGIAAKMAFDFVQKRQSGIISSELKRSADGRCQAERRCRNGFDGRRSGAGRRRI